MKITNEGLKCIGPYLSIHRKSVFTALLLSLAVAVLNFPIPLITKFVIDDVLKNSNMSVFTMLIMALLTITIVKSILSYFIQLIIIKVKEGILKQLRYDLVSKLLKINIMENKNIKIGYLVTRVINDPEMSSGLLADSIIKITISLLTFSFGLVALIYINIELTIISLAVLPFLLILQFYNTKLIRRYTREIMEINGSMNGLLADILSGIYTIKSFCAEKYFLDKSYGEIYACYNKKMQFVKVQNIASGIGSFITSIGPLIIMYFGIKSVIFGNISLGDYFAYAGYMAYIYVPLQSLFTTNIQVQGSISALERINEIYQMKNEEDINSHNIDNGWSAKYTISFSDVSFEYSNNCEFKLMNLSFNIPLSKHVAIVGKSGSGKTTIINMIMKYISPTKGTIYIDETDIRNINHNTIRNNISYVSQDIFLFADTVINNLNYVNNGITENDIGNILSNVGMNSSDEIYHNMILYKPAKELSGGEKQRIAVARALLKNANIIILDEATSELDSFCEDLVYNAIKQLSNCNTIIDITHKMKTILRADYVIFVDNGEVVCDGIHENLYRKYVKYREFIESCKLGQLQ